LTSHAAAFNSRMAGQAAPAVPEASRRHMTDPVIGTIAVVAQGQDSSCSCTKLPEVVTRLLMLG
jgi:hypothetical protein